MSSKLKSTYSNLMHSKFFNPAFNSAIFDGPFRIYFSQFQESHALKLYFYLQPHLNKPTSDYKNFQKSTGKNILILIYPTQESFSMSFESNKFIVTEDLDGDIIIGINGPFEDNRIDEVLNAIENSVTKWSTENSIRNEIQITV